MTETNDTVGSADAGEQLVLNSPEEAKTPRDFALWAGVILLAALVAFSPALHGKFLWDDDRHVENNRALRDADGLANIWTGHWRYVFADEATRKTMRVETPQYYPLTHTTFWLEYQLSGAAPGDINTTVFHATNIVLHAMSAILLWFILRELSVPGAWLAAAIWAVHPLQVESVAWISERKNVLAGVFFFGTIFTYLRASDPGSGVSGLERSPSPQTRDPSLYLLSIALFICAVLSKTVTCSAPAVILLLVWWKRGRIDRRDLLWTAPMFVIGIGLALLTSWVERNFVRASGAEYDLSFAQRILIAGNALWFYAGKLLVPAKLTFIYPKWNVSVSRPELWIAPITALAVLAGLFAVRNRVGRGPFVAVAIFAGVLLPALGFVDFYPMRYSFVADHFQYLAGAALIALVVAVASRVLARVSAQSPGVSYGVAGVVLVALMTLTVRHAFAFQSQVDLWRDTAAKNPDNAMVRHNYGTALLLSAPDLPLDQVETYKKWLDESTRQFARAIELKPDHDKAWMNWGNALAQLGKPDEAIAKYQKSLEVNPKNIDAMLGLGGAQNELKKYDDALATFRRAEASAIEQRGFVPRAKRAAIQHAIARALEAKKDDTGATQSYLAAIELSPDDVQIRYDYATLLARMGSKVPAAKEFAEAIERKPEYIDARLGLARLMIDVGNLQGAQVQLVAAARINTAYPPLMEAARLFDEAMKKREASTRPTTTPATMRIAPTSATTRP